jgi:hypothetical protein
MSRPTRNVKTSDRPPSPPRWRGRDSLKLVFQINEQGLQRLSKTIAGGAMAWPPVAAHRALWSAVDAGAIRRAVRLPFVILDARFMDQAWWRATCQDPERIAEAGANAAAWPADVSEELMSELLVFAWHMVKWDRRVAWLTLGILPGVADVLAALTPQQLAHISRRQRRVLQLRWQHDPAFWSRLLTTARDGDEQALSDIHLQAKILLSTTLIAQARVRDVPRRKR